MRALNLRRKGIESPIDDIVESIVLEIQLEARCFGVNLLWRRLRQKYGIHVKRQTVRDVLDALLPGELSRRKRNRLSRRVYGSEGPNHVVHVDQYDKIAKYGFFIHGAIDGFSRKIVWLEVGNTNRNSAVIAHFYLTFLRSIGGVPKTLRTDGGTENSLMLDIHTLLHKDILNSDHQSYIVGRSVHNQRIERFWGFLRSHFSQFWLDLFNEMMDGVLYQPTNAIHFRLLQFCFTGVLRNELNAVMEVWNHHKVRKCTIAHAAVGIPEVLYTLPEMYGKSDCKVNVDTEFVAELDRSLGCPLLQYGCDDDFAELFLEVMLHKGWTMPADYKDALDLYGEILAVLENEN